MASADRVPSSVRRPQLLAALLLLIVLFASAWPNAAGAEPADAKRAQALAHFKHGNRLFRNQQFERAVAAYGASRSLLPSKGNTRNLAIALSRIGRSDEALDVFESLLREYPDLSADDRARVDREIRQLAKRVGGVVVRASEPGATVVIDGRVRGLTPLSGAVRVTVGAHSLKVHKPGRRTHESTFELESAEQITIEVELPALAKSGRLKVSEASGRTLSVLVDGIVVGKTPWQALVSLGSHVVALRGDDGFATEPVAVAIKRDRTTTLRLQALRLGCQLRVDPIPPTARVLVDGIAVGDGTWQGPVRCGTRTVEVADRGYLKRTRRVAVEASVPTVIMVRLARDPSDPLWNQDVGRFSLGVALGAAITPGLGGPLDDSTPGVGGAGRLRFAYRFPSGFGLGLDVGALAIPKDGNARAVRSRRVPANTSLETELEEQRVLRALNLGAVVGYTIGDELTATLALGAGMAFGDVQARRTGRVEGVDLTPASDNSLRQRVGGAWLALAPELRLGYAVSRRVQLNVGIQALVLLALDTPSWRTDQDDAFASNVSGGSFVRFPADELSGETTWLIVPSLGVRHDFF